MLSGLAAVAAPAVAAGGNVSVTVVNDRNLNNKLDTDVDALLDGVTVTVTDSDGTSVNGDTGNDGVASIDTSTLNGGQYRVEVKNPDPNKWTEAQVEDGSDFTPGVSFVNGAEDAQLTVGYVDFTTLGPTNAALYSAIQGVKNYSSGAVADNNALYRIPISLTGPSYLSTQGQTGTLYGIGVDSRAQQVYAGAYAKRGTDYGPGGAGAVYRYDALTGKLDAQPYVVVPDAGDSDAHNWSSNQDFDFRTRVGRESLGDVDVSTDNKWLTVTNLNNDSLYVYPVQKGANPEPVQVLPVPAQDNCSADMWTPMALGEGNGKVYVGATCGSSLEVYLISYTRAADGTLTATGDIAKGNAGDDDSRLDASGDPNYGGLGRNVVADLNSSGCRLATWNKWADDLPSSCIAAGATSAGAASGNQVAFPEPMLADINVTDTGEFVFSYRDRGSDQYGSRAVMGFTNGTTARYGTYIVSGDTVNVVDNGGTLEFGKLSNGKDVDYDEQTRWNNGTTYGAHHHSGYAGAAYLPGTHLLAANQMDAKNIYTIGIRVFDYTTGKYTNNIDISKTDSQSVAFGKNAGLADIEAMVFNADQQIGNRVWIDKDRDGVQDGGEASVEGVKVNLYKGDDLVASTTTDSKGEYYFSTADGVKPNTDYEVRIDPEAFAAGGPLEGYVPTQAKAGDDAGVDSNGAKNDDGVVTASVKTQGDGVNDFSIDFGFVPAVSIGDYLWIDKNHNGLQDDDEAPAPDGTKVTLKDADGKDVATVETKDGYYAFTNLAPETEYTVVFPTTVSVGDDEYVLTTQGTDASSNADSNADPATGEAAVTTPGFEQGKSHNSGEPGKADDPTIDAGYSVAPRPSVSVGDVVWLDGDRDGLQGGDDDKPLAGVELTLYGADGTTPVTEDVYGNPIKPITTGDDGTYLFANLPVLEQGQSYTVKVTKTPKGVVPTAENIGEDRGQDSSTDEASSTADLSKDGAEDLTLDFGFIVPSVSVGDYVWFDANKDGVQGDDEKGIDGVTLTISRSDGKPVKNISGDEVTTTTTKDGGAYSFDDLEVLPEGETYIVTVTDPKGYTATKEKGTEDTKTDSSTGSATAKELADGERDDTLDFGFIKPSVSVGDFVWFDDNGDGVQDESEAGIEGVTLTLVGPDGESVIDINGKSVVPVKTKADGSYSFDDLPALPAGQHYTVKVTDPEGYTATKVGATDSDKDSSTGSAESGDLTEDGDRDTTLDFGFVKTPPAKTPEVSVGDYVWFDENGDGVQDETEAGIEGVTLTLVGPDGKPVADIDGKSVDPVKTDADGAYSFEHLPVLPEGSHYTVKVTNPEGYTATKENGTDDAAKDSSTGSAESGDLTKDGDRDETLDFGFVKTPETTPTPEPTPSVSVGDFVWVDGNDNGLQDDGDESGLEGVTLTISRSDDGDVKNADGSDAELTTTTDGNGRYSFDGLEVLPEGVHYVVTVSAPEGYEPAKAGQGDDRGSDSSTDKAESGDLTKDGDRDGTLDFGFVKTPPAKTPEVSVGDKVWFDENGDGVQDGSEKGIPDVELTITDEDGNPVTDVDGKLVEPTTTDENGEYTFEHLPALPAGHHYVVHVVAPKGYEPTKPGVGSRDKDSSTDSAESGDLTKDGDRDGTLDFGFVKTPVDPEPTPSVSIGDYVWFDENGDGVQDKGEKPVAGVTVTLRDSHGDVVKSVKTDKDGYYVFPDLDPSTDYTVEFPKTVEVDGKSYELTSPSKGGDKSKDSNPDADGVAKVTTPAEGANKTGHGQADDPSIDAGYKPVKTVDPTPEPTPSVSVGDKVWFDKNKNGKQDKGEPGIPDVELTLVGPDGKPVVNIHGKPVKPTKSGKNGEYEFIDLPALPAGQHYRVKVTAVPKGYAPTKPGVGDPSQDSSTGFADSSDLVKDGARDDTLDFGFVKPSVSVGDKVWFDKNKNGKQDKGEPGLEGVCLELVGPDGKPVTDIFGNVVKSVKTDKNGTYLFENLPVLPQGQHYTVKLSCAPEGYEPTKPGVGDPSQDSSTGSAESGELSVDGAFDGTLDFGFVSMDPAIVPVPSTPVPVDHPKGPLASTGAQVGVAIGAGIVLLLAGALTVMFTRRRRAH